MTDLFGQLPRHKTCTNCGLSKPLSDFYRAKGMRDGHRSDCKACNLARKAARYRANPEPYIERTRQWQEANPERHAERQRAYKESGKKKIADRKSYLKRRYAMTIDDFDRMLASQGGGCAICGETNVDNVDHDHATGLVRGILCFRCNAAIGLFDDEPTKLASAVDYLDRDLELDDLARNRARALAL